MRCPLADGDCQRAYHTLPSVSRQLSSAWAAPLYQKQSQPTKQKYTCRRRLGSRLYLQRPRGRGADKIKYVAIDIERPCCGKCTGDAAWGGQKCQGIANLSREAVFQTDFQTAREFRRASCVDGGKLASLRTDCADIQYAGATQRKIANYIQAAGIKGDGATVGKIASGLESCGIFQLECAAVRSEPTDRREAGVGAVENNSCGITCDAVGKIHRTVGINFVSTTGEESARDVAKTVSSQRTTVAGLVGAVVYVGLTVCLQQQCVAAGIGIDRAVVGEFVNIDFTGTGDGVAGVLRKIAAAGIENKRSCRGVSVGVQDD